jgi:hypothetical protein
VDGVRARGRRNARAARVKTKQQQQEVCSRESCRQAGGGRPVFFAWKQLELEPFLLREEGFGIVGAKGGGVERDSNNHMASGVYYLHSHVEMSMGNSPPGYNISSPSPSCLIHPHTHTHTHHGYKTHLIHIPIRVSSPQWVLIPN